VKDFIKVYWPLALIAFVGLIIGAAFIKPAPPGKITFAAGSPDGAYYAYAERYRALFDEAGIEAELLETNGSIDNLRLLLEGEADLALLQGGTAQAGDADFLRSLGGMFHEPLWVFARADIEIADFTSLKGSRIATGAEGSGTRMLARQIMTEFGGDWGAAASDPRSGFDAVNALLSGEVDAAIFSASVEAPYIQQLLQDRRVQLVPFPRGPALARRMPALAPVSLLRGVVDVGENLPRQDIPLIAPVAQLAARGDLHPAIQALALESAKAIHEERSLLAPAGTFPDGKLTDLPLSKEASRFYERGPSALRRWFPFSVANFLDRAWVLAIPLLTLLIPLVRAAPPLYRWRVRRKIYVWYHDLQELEERGRASENPAELGEVHDKLEALQVEIGKLDVPLSYTDDVYRLRSHVAFVQQLLGKPDMDPAAPDLIG